MPTRTSHAFPPIKSYPMCIARVRPGECGRGGQPAQVFIPPSNSFPNRESKIRGGNYMRWGFIHRFPSVFSRMFARSYFFPTIFLLCTSTNFSSPSEPRPLDVSASSAGRATAATVRLTSTASAAILPEDAADRLVGREVCWLSLVKWEGWGTFSGKIKIKAGLVEV